MQLQERSMLSPRSIRCKKKRKKVQLASTFAKQGAVAQSPALANVGPQGEYKVEVFGVNETFQGFLENSPLGTHYVAVGTVA